MCNVHAIYLSVDCDRVIPATVDHPRAGRHAQQAWTTCEAKRKRCWLQRQIDPAPTFNCSAELVADGVFALSVAEDPGSVESQHSSHWRVNPTSAPATGPPSVWRFGHETSQVIVCLPAQVPIRRGPLSSNARLHKTPSWVSRSRGLQSKHRLWTKLCSDFHCLERARNANIHSMG